MLILSSLEFDKEQHKDCPNSDCDRELYNCGVPHRAASRKSKGQQQHRDGREYSDQESSCGLHSYNLIFRHAHRTWPLLKASDCTTFCDVSGDI